MRFSAQALQDLDSVRQVSRFADDPAVERNHGVGREDRVVGMAARD